MKRWLALTCGLAIAAAAAYALLSSPSAEPPGPLSGERPPHSEIDEASRAQLEEVLRKGDENGGGA